MIDKQIILLAGVMFITLLYAYERQNPIRKRRCVAAVTVVLTLFSGLRSWWMGDLIKYYTLYRNCTGPNWRDSVFGRVTNTGLRLFFHYGNLIGLSYELCVFIIAAFSAITLGVLVFRYSPSPYWSYLVYIAMGFYLFTFSGLKQTIAMGFLCIAMIGVLEGNIWQFFIWTMIGALFHAPALIFLGAYPFARKKIDIIYVALVLALIAFVFFFRNVMASWLSDMYYEDGEEYEMSRIFGGRFIMMVFILVVGCILRPLRRNDVVYSYVFNLMVLAAALQTFSIYGNNFTRLADYYYQFVVLYIPLMLQPGASQAAEDPSRAQEIRYYNGDVYFFLSIGVTIFSLWYFIGLVNSGNPLITGYRFFWQINAHALYGA